MAAGSLHREVLQVRPTVPDKVLPVQATPLMVAFAKTVGATKLGGFETVKVAKDSVVDFGVGRERKVFKDDHKWVVLAMKDFNDGADPVDSVVREDSAVRAARVDFLVEKEGADHFAVAAPAKKDFRVREALGARVALAVSQGRAAPVDSAVRAPVDSVVRAVPVDSAVRVVLEDSAEEVDLEVKAGGCKAVRAVVPVVACADNSLI